MTLISLAKPVSEYTPEGISKDITGYLSPSLLRDKIAPFIFFRMSPFSPVPISASTRTAFLEILIFDKELILIIFTPLLLASLNAFLETPLSSLTGLHITMVLDRPNSFA